MKKYLLIVCAFIFVFTLTGCGSSSKMYHDNNGYSIKMSDGECELLYNNETPTESALENFNEDWAFATTPIVCTIKTNINNTGKSNIKMCDANGKYCISSDNFTDNIHQFFFNHRYWYEEN